MQQFLQLSHNRIGSFWVVLEAWSDVEEREGNMTKWIIVLESVDDVRIPLESDGVPIHDDRFQLVVYLERFRQQASSNIAHEIPTYVKNLQMLIAP